MTEPAESAPEVAPRWPWWVGSLFDLAVVAVVLMVVGELWFDGWPDLLSGLGLAVSSTLLTRSPWGRRLQWRRDRPSRWAGGRPEERWH